MSAHPSSALVHLLACAQAIVLVASILAPAVVLAEADGDGHGEASTQITTDLEGVRVVAEVAVAPPTDMLSLTTDGSVGPRAVEDPRAAWVLWILLTSLLILSAAWLIRGERHRRIR